MIYNFTEPEIGMILEALKQGAYDHVVALISNIEQQRAQHAFLAQQEELQAAAHALRMTLLAQNCRTAE